MFIALSQSSHGLQSRFLLAVQSEKLQTEAAIPRVPGLVVPTSTFISKDSHSFRKICRSQAKVTKHTKRHHKTQRPCSSWKGIAFTLHFLSLDNQEILLNAAIKFSFSWSNFTLCSLKKKKSQLPCYQFLSLNRGLTSWILRTAVGRALLPLLPLCLLFLHWSLNRILQPHPFVITKLQGSHASLFGIYLNDILDEQERLTVSKWDWIAEEMC